jgi:hypothetical protein
MSQSTAVAAPTDGGHNGRTTLSDLLADDVRDYFLREGGGAAVVTDHTTADFAPALAASAHTTTAAADTKRNVDGGRMRRRRRQRRCVKSDNENTTSGNGNSKGTNLLSTATSQTVSSLSSCSDDDDDDDDDDGDENDSRRWRKKGLQSYKSYQQNHGDDGGGREEQLRGQDTAERRDMNAIHHIIADAASQYTQNNMPRQKKQQQQQHQHPQRHTPHVSSFESELGNFHISHRQHDSFGSGSGSGISSPSSYMGRMSKSKYLSAADAEFLQRYAEEKERVSSRLSNLSPNSIQSNPSTMSPLSVHYKDQSPPPSRRPPTVMGSHRPALPSIDNDDWEEDDGIEKGLSDRARKERQMAKKKRRKKMENDAKVAAAASIRISSDRKSRSTFDHYQQPAGVSTPNISSGNDVAERYEGRVMSPSQLEHHRRLTLQSSNHEREDSAGTFVRLRGFSPARSMGDGSSFGGSDSANNSVVSNIYHSSRPLFYLSASSGSCSSGDGGSISNHFRGDTSTSFAAAAPATTDGISSSSGGSGYYQNRTVNNCNTSDFSNFNVNTSLLGYGVMNSPSSGRDESSPSPNNFARINNINQRTSRLQDTTMAYGRGVQGVDYLSLEDEKSSSSDESHDNDEGEDSEGSGYAMGSGSSDSSSNSSTEFQKQPLFRRSSSKGGLVRWNLANFDKVGSIQNNFDNPDIKGGGKGIMPSSERERLVGGPNYSSMGRTDAARSQISGGGGGSSSSKVRTTTKNDRHLHHSSGKRTKKKTRHQHHRLGGSGWPLRLDDAFDVLRMKMSAIFVALELLISNMPSLVGSLALAWCSLGVDWFKVREIWIYTFTPRRFV